MLSHLVLLGLAFGGITAVTLNSPSCITGLSTFPLFSHEARKIVPVRVNRRTKKKERTFFHSLGSLNFTSTLTLTSNETIYL